jgi:preprotein translocase subunit SecA
MRHDGVETLVSRAIPANSYVEQWDIAGLTEQVKNILHLDLPIAKWAAEDGIAESEIASRLRAAADEKYQGRAALIQPHHLQQAEKLILLSTLDQAWKDHLLQLDHLRSGIGLRAYGQRDPLNEYSREAFDLFSTMLDDLRAQVTSALLTDKLGAPSEEEILARRRAQKMVEISGADMENAALPEGMVRRNAAPKAFGAEAISLRQAFNAADPTTWGKTQRNAECPCGSGKKFKHCHGKFF